MRRTTYALVGALCLLCAGDTEAGLFRRRARRTCYPPANPCQVSRAAPPAAVGAGQPGEAGAFLAALNSWRSMHGRGPVGWSTGLAAYAASNAGVHAPGSSGGGSQAWAPTGSLMQALALWQSSPAHASILLSATVVGASRSATGCTANCR